MNIYEHLMVPKMLTRLFSTEKMSNGLKGSAKSQTSTDNASSESKPRSRPNTLQVVDWNGCGVSTRSLTVPGQQPAESSFDAARSRTPSSVSRRLVSPITKKIQRLGSSMEHSEDRRRRSMFHRGNLSGKDHHHLTSIGNGRPGSSLIHSEKLSKEYSKDELSEYEQVFRMFDTDGSGSIGTTELENAMRSLGINCDEEELAALIREVDDDGNGEIDFEEFCACLKKISGKKQSWEEVIKQCFEMESGCIKEIEFRHIMQHLGGFSEDRIIEEIFNDADVDGNGVIDQAEFALMVRNYLTEDDIY